MTKYCSLITTLGEPAKGRKVADLLPDIEKLSRAVPKGYEVTIVEGKDLVSKDSNGLSDPYVKVYIVNNII